MEKGQIEICLTYWYTVGPILRYIYLQYQAKVGPYFNVNVCLFLLCMAVLYLIDGVVFMMLQVP